MKSTSYGSMLGTLINNVKSQSLHFLLNKKKIDIIILKFRLFKSLKARRLLFVQSDVFCALIHTPGMQWSYMSEDQALQMDGKVWGGGFWSGHEG